jgi:hypothetical protein
VRAGASSGGSVEAGVARVVVLVVVPGPTGCPGATGRRSVVGAGFAAVVVVGPAGVVLVGVVVVAGGIDVPVDPGGPSGRESCSPRTWVPPGELSRVESTATVVAAATALAPRTSHQPWGRTHATAAEIHWRARPPTPAMLWRRARRSAV